MHSSSRQTEKARKQKTPPPPLEFIKLEVASRKSPPYPSIKNAGAHDAQLLSRLCNPIEQVDITALSGAHRDWRSGIQNQNYTFIGRYDLVHFVCAVRRADDSSVLTPRGSHFSFDIRLSTVAKKKKKKETPLGPSSRRRLLPEPVPSHVPLAFSEILQSNSTTSSHTTPVCQITSLPSPAAAAYHQCSPIQDTEYRCHHRPSERDSATHDPST